MFGADATHAETHEVLLNPEIDKRAARNLIAGQLDYLDLPRPMYLEVYLADFARRLMDGTLPAFAKSMRLGKHGKPMFKGAPTGFLKGELARYDRLTCQFHLAATGWSGYSFSWGAVREDFRGGIGLWEVLPDQALRLYQGLGLGLRELEALFWKCSLDHPIGIGIHRGSGLMGIGVFVGDASRGTTLSGMRENVSTFLMARFPEFLARAETLASKGASEVLRATSAVHPRFSRRALEMLELRESRESRSDWHPSRHVSLSDEQVVRRLLKGE